MISDHKTCELLYVGHRVDRRGGQERSTLEILTRLALLGYKIRIISFELEDWPNDLPIQWTKIPGSRLRPQLLKNIFFSLVTLIFTLKRKNTIIMTTGTSSWRADLRVIQFIHKAYYDVIKRGQAPYPKANTILRKSYQYLFIKWNIFLEEFFFPRTKAFVVISERVRKDLNKLLGEKGPELIRTIHHAPDEIDMTSVQKGSGPEKILFVGSLERKGIKKFLDILSLIRDLPWQANIVGDGDLPYWKKYARQQGLESRVIFHGVQNAQNFFLQATIFLFPSTYEPFGLVVSEAATAICLPLASLECGAMDLWATRDARLKLSSFDANEKWATTLRYLLQNPLRREEFAQNAKTSFHQWSWDNVAHAYSKIIQELLL